MHRSWTLAIAMLLVAIRPAIAQVTVRADRDLDFDYVTAGIAKSIAPADPVASGQWTLILAAGSHVKLEMTLPTRLQAVASTATMTVSFANVDAFLQETGGPIKAFNPNVMLNYKFTVSTTAIVRLGGRVSPTAGQAFGVYQSTVLVTITLLN